MITSWDLFTYFSLTSKKKKKKCHFYLGENMTHAN